MPRENLSMYRACRFLTQVFGLDPPVLGLGAPISFCICYYYYHPAASALEFVETFSKKLDCDLFI